MDPSPYPRLDAFLALLDRLSLWDLTTLQLPIPDFDRRAELLNRVDEAVAFAGAARAEEYRATRPIVRELMFRRIATDALGIETGFGPHTTRSAEELTRLALAIEDAAVAVVVGDLLTPDDAEELSGPFDLARQFSFGRDVGLR